VETTEERNEVSQLILGKGLSETDGPVDLPKGIAEQSFVQFQFYMRLASSLHHLL